MLSFKFYALKIMLNCLQSPTNETFTQLPDPSAVNAMRQIELIQWHSSRDASPTRILQDDVLLLYMSIAQPYQTIHVSLLSIAFFKFSFMLNVCVLGFCACQKHSNTI